MGMFSLVVHVITNDGLQVTSSRKKYIKPHRSVLREKKH